MEHKAYFLDNNAQTMSICQDIMYMIPCFTQIEIKNENYFIFSIECRKEDIRFVEEKLAPFI